MKVFITTTGDFPNGGANSNRILCYAKGLQKHGIDCEVLTTSHRDVSNQDVGVKYLRFGNDVTKRSFVFRLLNYITSTILLKNYIKSKATSEDVVLMYHNELLQDFVILPLHKTIRVVRELCEIPNFDNRLSSKIARLIHYKFYFKKFSGFLAISMPLEKLANEHKNVNSQVLKVPILVDLDNYAIKTKTDIAKSLKQPYIFHSGSMTENKDGFIGMLETIAIVKRRGFLVHLYSTGSPDIIIRQKIKELDIESEIHFLGFLEKQHLVEYQSDSLAFIINKHDTLQNHFCFPTKLGEYLATSRPVITTNIGESQFYLKHGHSAYITHDKDVEGFAEYVITLIRNPEEAKRIGLNGYNVAKECFSYEIYGKRLADFLHNIVHV